MVSDGLGKGSIGSSIAKIDVQVLQKCTKGVL
jgi:hypothetical protein